MIRPLTLICVVLFLFSGFYDYQTTHQVDLKDQQISTIRAQAIAARQSSKILQTEWSWLNRPDRLQPFAAQFLSLQEVAPSQYVPLAQLAQHLPAPGSVPAIAPNVEFAAAAPIAAPIITLAAAPITPAAAPVAAPVKLASALPVAKPTAQPRLAEQAPVKTPAKAPATQLASIEPQSSPEPAAPAKPRAVAVASAAPARRIARPVARPVMVAENEPPRSSPIMSERSASSLGMAQGGLALPAPVAVSDAAWRNDQ